MRSGKTSEKTAKHHPLLAYWQLTLIFVLVRRMCLAILLFAQIGVPAYTRHIPPGCLTQNAHQTGQIEALILPGKANACCEDRQVILADGAGVASAIDLIGNGVDFLSLNKGRKLSACVDQRIGQADFSLAAARILQQFPNPGIGRSLFSRKPRLVESLSLHLIVERLTQIGSQRRVAALIAALVPEETPI